MGSLKQGKISWEKWCKEHPNFIPLEEYKGSNAPIKIRHVPCGKENLQRPGDLKNGHGCRHCSRLGNTYWQKRKVHPIRFLTKRELESSLGEDYLLLGEKDIFRLSDKVKVYHKICGTTYTTRPFLIERGARCHLGLCKDGKSHEQFAKELKEKNPYVSVVGKYRGTNTKIKFKCNKCGHVWLAVPYSILQKHGCPECKIKSGAEREIKDWLLKHNIPFKHEATFSWSKRFRYDFFIPGKNLLIEYHGIQHYEQSPLFKQSLEERQLKDEEKERLAKENGKDFLVIPYTQRDDIEKILTNIFSKK